MLDNLKNILKLFFAKLGVTEDTADGYTSNALLKIKAATIDQILKNKLSEEELKQKNEEYVKLLEDAKYTEVISDFEKYIDEESGKFFASAFLDEIKETIKDLLKEGAITKEKAGELIDDLTKEIEKYATLNKVTGADSTQGSLEALAN
jgi:hypothetical protein